MGERVAKIVAWSGAVIVTLLTLGAAVLAFLVSFSDRAALADPINGLISALIGALVVTKRYRNPVGWAALLIGLCLATSSFTEMYILFALPFGLDQVPGAVFLLWLSSSVWAGIFIGLVLLFHLFPTGHPLSARWGYVLKVSVLAQLTMAVFFSVVSPLTAEGPDGAILEFPNPIGLVTLQDEAVALVLVLLILILPTILALFALLSRFAQARGAERQQMKWFLYAASLFLIILILSFAQVILPLDFLVGIAALGMPISIGIAMFRYRLYDIDILIRRTLTYTLVAGLLLVVYFGSVILLQRLFSDLTGLGRNEIITVISTLAIAALFIPLRNWIQGVIDRRFNRNKYNAQRVMQDFAQTVRDETDLEKLTARLIEVVDETMQPKSVSIWLKAANEYGRTNTE